MATIKLQVRRDTASNWTSINPILLSGEIGFELDTGKLKIGKAIEQHWNDIDYIVSERSHSLIVAGTATKISYDENGFVIAGTTLSSSDIPNLAWSKITTGKPTTLSGYGIVDAYTITLANSTFALAEHVHTLNDLQAEGTRSITTYLRGDGNWAPVSGIVSEVFTNWLHNTEVVLDHTIERNGNRIYVVYQEKSGNITDGSWSFNAGSSADWENGRLLNGKLTTEEGILSSIISSTHASQISTIPWTSISSASVSDNAGIHQTTTIDIRYALSFDDRLTWKIWNGSVWLSILPETIAVQGMSSDLLNAIPSGQWATQFVAGTLDLLAYLSTDNVNLLPAINEIQFNVNSTYWESLPAHQITATLMATNTHLLQTTGETIAKGKVVIHF